MSKRKEEIIIQRTPASCKASSASNRYRRSLSTFPSTNAQQNQTLQQAYKKTNLNFRSNQNSEYENIDTIIDSTENSNKSSDGSPTYSISCEDFEVFNRINPDQLMIDNMSWLAEKPISVLQLDMADRAVLKIADQRDKIQKKTFTKWVNKHLSKLSIKINELFDDLRDGIHLIYLLEILSERTLRKEKGSLRFHALQNVQTCLNFLMQHNVS
jgi:hypothetical protein